MGKKGDNFFQTTPSCHALSATQSISSCATVNLHNFVCKLMGSRVDPEQAGLLRLPKI